MKKTLYLSDLDGTLLRSDARTSEYTNRTVNRLVDEGMLFSYATARSFETASKVTEGLEAEMPVIVHNGAFVLDSATRRPLWSARFSPSEETEIYGAFTRRGLYPLTYAVIDGKSRFSYLWDKSGRGQRDFINSRQGDGRARMIDSEDRALDGAVFYFTCIDDEERLRPVYEQMKDKYRCFFSRDIYTDEPWLEILPANASKASAALHVKELYGCDRIVCFGDEINDIPMFEIADESYAVENAAPELKEIATGIIPCNDEDGVAHWLEAHAEFTPTGKGKEENTAESDFPAPSELKRTVTEKQ